MKFSDTGYVKLETFPINDTVSENSFRRKSFLDADEALLNNLTNQSNKKCDFATAPNINVNIAVVVYIK